MRLQVDVADGIMEEISAYAEANDVRLRRIVSEALSQWIKNPTLRVFKPLMDLDQYQTESNDVISDIVSL
jgi:hypothetical protein